MMKFLSTAAVVLAASSCSAFVPTISKFSYGRVSYECPSQLHMNLPFFAQEQDEESTSVIPDADNMTLDQEVDILVEQEKNKLKKMSKLSGANGVEYAPWMGITESEETQIRQIMREKTSARRARQEQQRDVSGNLFRDSQAQELSGTGLSYKTIDGEVELEWATRSESNTVGFVVKRRAAKTNDYSVIASYREWGPLASKGEGGGVYRFLDTTVTPGGWVYRISEEDRQGNSADICQCLVEVQTEDEQKAALFAGVGISVFALLVLAAGIFADPMNGF